MRTMTIKSIAIKNFKNIAEYTHNFDEKREIIASAVGSGKSTIFEAYKWVLGFDVKNYEPTDNGNLIPNLKTCVEMEFTVDGLDYTLRRESERKASGITTRQSFCGYDIKTLKDYQSKVVGIFGIDKRAFELLADIKEFNNVSTSWKWDNQRKFLFELFGVDSKIADIINKEEYAWVKQQLSIDKSIDEVKITQKLNTEGNAIQKQLDNNNAIIENAQADIAEISKIPFEELKKEQAELQKELDEGGNKKKYELITMINAEIDKLYGELNTEKTAISRANSAKMQEKLKLENDMRGLIATAIGLDNIIKREKSEIETLKKQLDDITASKYEPKTVCETCGQPLPKELIEKGTELFESKKAESIAKITAELEKATKTLNEAVKSKSDMEKEYHGCKSKLDALSESVVDTSKVDKITAEIKAKEIERDNISNSDVSEREKEINARIAEISKLLVREDELNRIKDKINNIRKQNLELAKKDKERLSRLEAVKNFTQEKVAVATKAVNSHFKQVSFQFFKTLINGSIETSCIAFYKGSSYEQCSVGQKIGLNFYLNQALQKFYEISLPVWLDDMGSAENLTCEQQFIGLLTDNSKMLEYKRIRETK